MERQSAMQLFRRWRQGTIFRSVRLEKQSVWFLVRAKTRTCRRVWQQWTRWAAMQQMHQRMDTVRSPLQISTIDAPIPVCYDDVLRSGAVRASCSNGPDQQSVCRLCSVRRRGCRDTAILRRNCASRAAGEFHRAGAEAHKRCDTERSELTL